MLNKDFYFLEKINEILIKVIKEEKEQITNENNYYCDKGFIFNNDGDENVGFKINNIIYTKSYNNIFCILFSFLLKESEFQKEDKIIFSIVDSENNEKLTLFEKDKHIFIRFWTKNKNEINLIKAEYNTIYNFMFFLCKNILKICINGKDIFSQNFPDFVFPDNFKVLVGCPEIINNNRYSFKGIIYPILLFELKENKKINGNDIYLHLKKLLLFVKNKYYLIAEEYFSYNSNIKQKKGKEIENIEKIIHTYEMYYGLNEDLIKRKMIGKIFDLINNMILYINPHIITSSFNKKALVFKDYNSYQNEYKKNINYYYRFNDAPFLKQEKLFTFKDNHILSFLKTNNGINYISLQMEALFNYILLLYNNKDMQDILNKNKKKFFSLM